MILKKRKLKKEMRLVRTVKKARENGEKEFEVGGKKYKLKEKKEITEQEDTEEFVGDSSDEDVEEGNAF